MKHSSRRPDLGRPLRTKRDSGLVTTDASRGVRSIVTRRRRSLAFIASLSVAETAVGLAQPWPLKLAVDNVANGAPFPAVLTFLNSLDTVERTIVVVAATLGLVGLASTVDYIARTRSARLSETIGAELRLSMMSRILGLDAATRAEHGSGDLLSRVGSDVDRVQGVAVTLAGSMLTDVATLIGVAIVLLAIDPMLATAALAIVPALWLVTVRRRAAVLVEERAYRRAHASVVTSGLELVRHSQLIQIFGQQRPMHLRYSGVNDDVVSSSLAVTATEARYRPAAEFITTAVGGLCLAIGIRRVVAGTMSTGTLLVLMAYVNQIFVPVRSLSGLAASLSKAGASRDRVDEILCAPGASTGGDLSPPTTPATIRFDRVCFAYDGRPPVLHDIDLCIPGGSYVAVVGASGAGKTTLLRLLMRSLRPSSGTIAFDGVDIASFEIEAFRSTVAYVPQDSSLLTGSIADNIAFGSPTANRGDLGRAAWVGGADRFVVGLPDGYDTIVGEDGERLSGGQRRRIALARAAVRDAPLMLLDEPTTGLDPLSESAVLSSLRRMRGQRTIVAISHHLSLAFDADLVIVLDDGRITDVGPPAALVAAGGPFSRLWHASQDRIPHTNTQGDSHVEDERLLEPVGRLRWRQRLAQVEQVEQVAQVEQVEELPLRRPAHVRGDHLRVVPLPGRRVS